MRKEFVDSYSWKHPNRSSSAAKASVQNMCDFSMKFQWVDEHSRACVAWLEKNDPKKWIPVEEFKPAPVHVALPVPTSIVMPNL
jgi:hypothetical protein